MAETQSFSTQNTSPKMLPWQCNRLSESTHPVHKTLATVANLTNLLPTGTVLAFRTLTPSFSNTGNCRLSNVCLTACLIAVCAIACFFSCFTDSFVDYDGKLYYGIATFRGFYVFNSQSSNESRNVYRDVHGPYMDPPPGENYEKAGGENTEKLSGFKITAVDFVHAFVSMIVFMIFALSDSDVQGCFFHSKEGEDLSVLMINLPIGAGVLSTFLFVIFPTTRKGIGYAGMPTILL